MGANQRFNIEELQNTYSQSKVFFKRT